ncbi:uncharacterized protein DUF4157 [Chitinophaga sp. S165]|nr:uncharacterized protein DUF4157 [Chitinophaga sp. S165]
MAYSYASMSHEHNTTQAIQTATRSVADNQLASGISKPAVQPLQKVADMPFTAPAGDNNGQAGTVDRKPFQLRANNTGLPDNLKSGIENLSGYSMDDVRVNYNSARPAQLQAHAYAQGTDIHVAPGQEKHLAHEAWHVVQQKQGRVSPTFQLKSDIPVNDDAALEQEADVMGEKALQFATAGPAPLKHQHINNTVLQGAFLDIAAASFTDYIAEQETKQKEIGAHRESFTTVGFEHEFTQTEGEGNSLAGISHLELAKARPLAFTKLPFILETDAANALELVSPPFLIKTLTNTMIPDPADIEKVDSLIRVKLLELSTKGTIDGMLKGFKTAGLDFSAAENLKIEQKNVSHKSGVKDYASAPDLEFKELKKIKIKPTEKGGGITSQVNFATTAQTFDDLQNINKEDALDITRGRKPGFNPKAILATLEKGIKVAIAQTGIAETPGRTIFINQLARTLSGQFAVPAIEHVKNEQERIYDNTSDLARNKGATSKFRFNAYLSSAVKDVDGAWIKDSLMNIGLGVLKDDDWRAIRGMVTNARLADGIRGLELPEFTNINGFEKESEQEEGNALIAETLQAAKASMIKALSTIATQIEMVYTHDLMTKEGYKSTELGIFPNEAVGFMGHNDEMIGARQDTYIDTRKAQLPQVTDERLHVAETRKDGVDSLYMLAFKTDKLDIKGLEAMAQFQAAKISAIDLEIVDLEKAKAVAEEDIKDTENAILLLRPRITAHYRDYDVQLEQFKKQFAETSKGNVPPRAKQITQFDKKFDPEGLKDKLEKGLPGKRRQQTPVIEKKEKEIKEKRKEQEPYQLLIKAIVSRIVRKQIMDQYMGQQQLF